MERSLRSLLLKPQSSGSGSLFRSAADLAGVIAEREGARFKNRQTIATLLSNVFLRRRSCSSDLADAIVEAARARLKDRPTELVADFVAELQRAIAAANRSISHGGRYRDSGSAGDPNNVREPNDISVERAMDLFRYVGDHLGLVCCEYRDHPRAHSEGKYSKLGLVAAQGVANGGFFALFVPFPDVEVGRDSCRHTRAVRDYVRTLRRLARDAHHLVLVGALRARRENESEEAVSRRIVRYERGVPEGFKYHALLTTGIQSRLFYIQVPLAPEHDLQEVWEWVAADDEKDDFFIQRRDSSIPKQVVRDQLFPIVKEWIIRKELLPTSAKVSEAIDRWSSESEADAMFPNNFWIVPEPPEVALENVKKIYGSAAQRIETRIRS